ncbi:MAG: HAMP domain-containing histidine kinase [Planctomycetes bacterium]|nr:HAMP domain-containing histidine kinase [Planctomycetota bacterium]
MNPRSSWLLFVIGAGIALASMWWLSRHALGLAESEASAREQSRRDAVARVALWRMDTDISALISAESATSVENFARMGRIPEAGGATGDSASLVRIRFEIAATGAVSGAPGVLERPVAERLALIDVSGSELNTRALPEVCLDGQSSAMQQTDQWSPQQTERQSAQSDYGNRSKAVKRQVDNAMVQQELSSSTSYRQKASPGDDPPKPLDKGSVVRGPMSPRWLEPDDLVLLRPIERVGQVSLQGCWLDRPALDARLRSLITDILPHARLVRAQAGDPGQYPLASLPLALIPGDPAPDPTVRSPIARTLLVAWIGIGCALAALAALLAGVLALGERRAMFVSAVTHELRTPITSLRMYAEMLGEGMVAGGEQRARYLATIRAEADRLGRLVENVLSYARLERSSHPGRMCAKPLAELIAGCGERLTRRCVEAGMELTIDLAQAASAQVIADPEWVEQILFNLVDNACKYAASAKDRCIAITAEMVPGSVRIAVADHGPGIAEDVRKRLFRPFAKSAREAAHSAPGVGLGLSLSRRLARRMGGELELEASTGEGTRMRLMLRSGVQV